MVGSGGVSAARLRCAIHHPHTGQIDDGEPYPLGDDGLEDVSMMSAAERSAAATHVPMASAAIPSCFSRTDRPDIAIPFEFRTFAVRIPCMAGAPQLSDASWARGVSAKTMREKRDEPQDEPGGRMREHHGNIFDRLLRDRIVFLREVIDDMTATHVIAQLLFLESEDPDEEITLYINSPGGIVYSGLGIYDTMRHLRAPVSTVCVGLAASFAAVLLAAGEKGRRRALPNARVMIHQPRGATRGQASDVQIQSDELQVMRDRIAEILADACGKTPERLSADMDRDHYMSAEGAKAYGLIDDVLLPRTKGET
jgi:ATP-dependent Clp protease protease subunit